MSNRDSVAVNSVRVLRSALPAGIHPSNFPSMSSSALRISARISLLIAGAAATSPQRSMEMAGARRVGFAGMSSSAK